MESLFTKNECSELSFRKYTLALHGTHLITKLKTYEARMDREELNPLGILLVQPSAAATVALTKE